MTQAAKKKETPAKHRKEWRDPEGSIIRKKVEKRDSKGRLKETEVIFVRVRYTDQNGKRREKKRIAPTAADAPQVRRNLRQEIQDELRGEIEERQRPKTFNEVLDYYETEFVKEAVIVNDQKIEGFKEDLDTIRRQLKRFRAEFGSLLVKHVTYDSIRRYKTKRLKEAVTVEYYEKIPLTEDERKLLPKNSRRRFRYEKRKKTGERKFASVHRELSRLRRILNVAVRQGWLVVNPFQQGESLIQPGLETSRLRICTFEEEDRIIAECTSKREHLKAIIIFALDSAMRKGEIFRMRWSDVDTKSRRIFVQATNTKTGKSRYVPMTRRVIAELKPLQELAGEDDLVFGIKTDADRAWDSALDAAGIDDLTFHDLRATAITRMLRAGMQESEVMKISGHTQYSTFLKYVRQDTLGAATAADKMDEYLARKSGA